MWIERNPALLEHIESILPYNGTKVSHYVDLSVVTISNLCHRLYDDFRTWLHIMISMKHCHMRRNQFIVSPYLVQLLMQERWVPSTR
jgi:hypothetical protein